MASHRSPASVLPRHRSPASQSLSTIPIGSSSELSSLPAPVRSTTSSLLSRLAVLLGLELDATAGAASPCPPDDGYCPKRCLSGKVEE